MALIRWVEVNVLTGECTPGEGAGNLRSDRPATRLGRLILQLSDVNLLMRDVDGMPSDLVDTLIPPTETVVRIPEGNEVVYDFGTGWLKPAPRPTFEEAHGGTVDELVERSIAVGAPPAIARIAAEALRDEYDAYDPLEGVHPYGTSIEDIAQAAIVAAEARAARRATE